MKVPNAIGSKAAWALVAVTLLTGCSGATPEAILASGKEYLAKNDRPAAVIQLKNALQKSPDLVEARYLLGKTQLEMGEVQAAEKELRRASELKHPPDEVIPPLARAMLFSGEYKKVITEFGKTDLTTAEANADLQTTLGQAHLAQGNREAAGAAFAAALAAKSGYPEALLGQARLKARTREQLPEALAIVETALASAPKLTEAWQFKGDILAAQGQSDPALAAYLNAVQVKPDFVPAHAQIVVLYSQQGKADEAAKQLETMKKVAPRHPNTLYLQALLAYQKKDFAAAREAIQQELRLAPDYVPGLLLAGVIEIELKSYAQAEANLLKVLQRVPDQSLARRALIVNYLRSAQPEKALEAVRPVLETAENDSNMMALAGEVYMQNGDIAEAARYFEKAATLDPKDPNKRTARALSQLAGGEIDRPLRELEQVAATDTGIRADLALVAAHLRRRDFDKALAAIDALEKKQPESAVPHNLRGAALVGKGDEAAARRSFERALTLNASFFPALANLAKLDLKDKKPDDAKKRFEAVLVKDPKNVQALLAIAELRAQSGGSAEEVAALIGKAITANPVEPSPRLVLIALHLRNKDPKKAVVAAQEALVALPDRPEILNALGTAQQAAGDLDQALATTNGLVKLQPNSVQALMRLAQIQVAAKDNDAARRSLGKALALKPDLVGAQRALISIELSAGRVAEALALARDMQKRKPTHPNGFVFEGDIHSFKNQWKEAANAYRAALRQGATGEVAAKLHLALRTVAEPQADKFATTWSKEHPKDGVFRVYLAQMSLAKKDYPAAIRHYQGLLELQPNNAAWLNNLAWAAGQVKDPKALDYAETANKLAPDQPPIMDTLGVLLVEQGATERGVELLRKASTQAPETPGIRLNLAKGLIKAGQKDAAKRELDELAKLGDKFPAQAEVSQMLKAL